MLDQDLPRFTVDPEVDVLAVVDTNVLLDVFSCHDLSGTYDRLGAAACDDAPEAIYRRARARESLLLAMYFHEVGALTYSVREPVRLIAKRVDPEAHDALETHYTKLFVHFVHARVVNRWRPGMPDDPEQDPTGNRADAALVSYAAQHRLPIVSNESYGPDGLKEHKLRSKSAQAGVRVFTPHEFYAGKLEETGAIDGFLKRFNQLAPAYIQAQPRPEIVRDSLRAVLGYYRHVLLGETRGRDDPVAVCLRTSQSTTR